MFIYSLLKSQGVTTQRDRDALHVGCRCTLNRYSVTPCLTSHDHSGLWFSAAGVKTYKQLLSSVASSPHHFTQTRLSEEETTHLSSYGTIQPADVSVAYGREIT